MELLQSLPNETLQSIREGIICRALDCYQPFTLTQLGKKLRICKRHASGKQLVRYHCEGCGTILYDMGRGQQPVRLCETCIHEAKKLRHREYHARIREMKVL